MAIDTIQNERLDYQKELLDLNRKSRREIIKKTFFATALAVAAIATVAFLHGQFLAIGLGIILISGISIYNYFSYYKNSNRIFTQTAALIG